MAKSKTKGPGPRKMMTSPEKEMTSPEITETGPDKISLNKKTKKKVMFTTGISPGSKRSETINSKKAIKKSPGGKRIATQSAKCLLEDDDVRRWYENMARSSQLNADVRLRRLNLFCYRLETTPAALAKMGQDNPKKIEDLLMDHVSWMESQEFAAGYTDGMIKAIKGWLVHNRIEIKTKIKIANISVCPTLEKEKIPEQKQLHKILENGNVRQRAIISLMAFAGIRPQVMGLADRTDGLCLKDLPELVIEDKGQTVRFANMPAMIIVRQTLSKTRNKYVTFLIEEGCQHLLKYFEHRVSTGERLSPDSPVIAREKKDSREKHRENPNVETFVVTGSISRTVKKAMESTVNSRPYSLRAYFDTQLLLAESHGCIADAYRTFFMGHKGDIEARYTVNKGRLTEHMREDMRRAYAQSEMFLSTDPNKADEEYKKDMLCRQWRKQAEMYGINPDNIINSKGSEPPITSNISSADKSKEPATPIENEETAECKIIKGDAELVYYSSRGWDIVKELNDGRFLMRRSHPRSD